MKLKRYREIIRDIEINPTSHNQDRWHCGTSHCIAGHAELRAAGYKNPGMVDVTRLLPGAISDLGNIMAERLFGNGRTRLHRFVRSEAAEDRTTTCDRAGHYLGLTERQRIYLFDASRTFPELKQVAERGEFPPEVY